MKRITIIAGHYGSGKSEISVNLALNHKLDYIVDLDIINPYFRSRALNDVFEANNIRLVESTIRGKLNSDMPYVSGEAAVPFVQTGVTAIYDLGGTENGGRVLIQFVDRIKDIENIDLLYVVNIFRPETANKDLIVNAIGKLEGESQLKVTGLINNTNLMHLTTLEEVLQGEEVLKEVSKELNLPIKYTVVEENHTFDHIFEGELLILERLVAKRWL
ncbi:hypothetical protein KQ51_00899 [Candidatus Izimaplasma bacterium HR1]|jgi:hypothetical protein|uniref:hypothetical protein n=1 Tax=Candidatus Izimoplasma sp. HR1 TaxID=1541959 RepID=UPI0004F85925|nr:hypothetical protein KQ51_00899 [Candidatus Izimaplasma bacterium HR1]